MNKSTQIILFETILTTFQRVTQVLFIFAYGYAMMNKNQKDDKS